MRTSLDHLPEGKRRELQRIVEILFAEFEDALKGRNAPHRKAGRILKIILFGSYARGDWVDDPVGGYKSDYDLLVVVNHDELADTLDYWREADDHLLREYQISKRLSAPANFIVHSLTDLNGQLKRGRPFFVDIVRDGVALYEAPDQPFEQARALSREEAAAEARGYFQEWFVSAGQFLETALDHIARGEGWSKKAAFELHQATERYYHCLLLVLTLYSPKSHKLNFLRSQAERLAPEFIDAWPRESRFQQRCWELLRRAYVDARYSLHYKISDEELTWLSERVGVLAGLVERVCTQQLRRLEAPPEGVRS
ncbi:HEPN domain-containing protein [Phenylobacterium sp.]|uniref:HEPN domain-containing protein n=1 Tax=Phenylobacterium sp. TaxID=1871053 RepID=UPI002F92BCC3